jgi:site-specific recombinase XerD
MASIVQLPAVVTVASELISSWQRHLRAKNKSPRTIDSYSESARRFVRFLADHGDATDLATVQQQHVERSGAARRQGYVSTRTSSATRSPTRGSPAKALPLT